MNLVLEIILGLSFLAALAYLVMYQRNPHRRRSMVSNMLLHLGWVQVTVYGGGLVRLVLIPKFDFPVWFEFFILMIIYLMSMSLTFWVLIAYVLTIREREEIYQEEEASLDSDTS